jgi:hypothetical protein
VSDRQQYWDDAYDPTAHAPNFPRLNRQREFNSAAVQEGQPQISRPAATIAVMILA